MIKLPWVRGVQVSGALLNSTRCGHAAHCNPQFTIPWVLTPVGLSGTQRRPLDDTVGSGVRLGMHLRVDFGGRGLRSSGKKESSGGPREL